MRTVYCFALLLLSLLSSDVVGSPIYYPRGLAPRDDCNPTSTSALGTAVFTIPASAFDSGVRGLPVPTSTVCVDFLPSEGSVTPSARFCSRPGAPQPTGPPVPVASNNAPFANSTHGASDPLIPFPSSSAPMSPRAPFVVVPDRGPGGVDVSAPTLKGAAFPTSPLESPTPSRGCGSKPSPSSNSVPSSSSGGALPQTVGLPQGVQTFSTPAGVEPTSLSDSLTTSTSTIETITPSTTPSIEPSPSSPQLFQPPSFTISALAFSSEPQLSSKSVAPSTLSTQPLTTPSTTPGSVSPNNAGGIDLNPFE